MQNMQMESNFFYYADVFVNLIEPIAESRDEKTLIKFCDQLYDYLAGYKNAYPESLFTSEIKKFLLKTKPNTVETYEKFIKDLKKIPPDYLQWGNREKNALTSAENTILKIKKQKNPRSIGQTNFRQPVTTNANHVSSNQFEYLGKKRPRADNKPIKNISKNNNYYVKNILNKNNNYNNKTIKGLPNIDLSCYLNTALQALFHDKQFRKTVLNSSCSGRYEMEKNAVRFIFEYMKGTEELAREELEDCYKQIGHKESITSTSDEWRQKIKSWFEDEYKPKNEISTVYDAEEGARIGALSEMNLKAIDPNIKTSKFSPRKINIEVSRLHPNGKKMNANIGSHEFMTFGADLYELTFVTIHSETDDSGHYYSYVKKGNTWTKINDNNVSNCDWADIKDDIGTNCTFLRYEKIK